LKGVCSDISFSFFNFVIFNCFIDNTIDIGFNEKGTFQDFTFGWFSIASKPHFPNKKKKPVKPRVKRNFLFIN